MINTSQIKVVYLLGIGGIGMSALARYFKSLGKAVYGYDKTPTNLTTELEKQGMKIHFTDAIESLPSEINTVPKEEILIIYTPAIPKDHTQMNHLLSNGFMLKKRSTVLGEISSEEFTVAVAGTHGKTTTSSMITWMLHNAGRKCTSFLGGIATNFNSNFIAGDQKAINDKACIVLEADEYDRSFLTLSPSISVITSTDADHLDIYHEGMELEKAYKQFADRLEDNGILFIKYGLELNPKNKYFSYGIHPKADFRAENIRVENGSYVFDFYSPTLNINNLTCGLGGRHNVENAVAACAVSVTLGLNEEEIKSGVANFRGVKRRFETIFKSKEITYIDDYAHHPTELNSAINSAKELFPGKKITGIFQPHLYSRTRDFAIDFKESLSKLDILILLEIYPARELPIDGVTAQMILPSNEQGKIRIQCDKSDAVDRLFEFDNEIILTLGAGDIDTLVSEIKSSLEKSTKEV